MDQDLVLITGVSSFWGSKLANHFLINKGIRLLGIDTKIPDNINSHLDFIKADLRNPLLTELIRAEGVEVVCHVSPIDNQYLHTKESVSKFHETINLIEACENTEVKKIIFMSSTAVYGAHHTNPAYIPEESALRGKRNIEFTHDLVELENHIESYRNRNHIPKITTLRFAHIIGPSIDNYLTRYLENQLVITSFGYNPRMQIVHEEDVLNAITHAVINDKPGVYNIAAPGVLPLNRLINLSGRSPIPLPSLLLTRGYKILPFLNYGYHLEYLIDSDLLKFSCVADISKMAAHFEFKPLYTAEESLRDFAALRLSNKDDQALPYTEQDIELLRDMLNRRQRARENKPDNAA